MSDLRTVAAREGWVVLPADTGGDDAELERLGFELGGVIDGEPRYREVRLPAGWRLTPIWSDERRVAVVDQTGAMRAGAFCGRPGRRAFMWLSRTPKAA